MKYMEKTGGSLITNSEILIFHQHYYSFIHRRVFLNKLKSYGFKHSRARKMTAGPWK